ncbi:MAG: DUF559 domain-containing protein [Pasteurellaceae bacterium]|nr:DUF559 domain-containing protein [Pasteurellaceae bacterium]
MREKETAKLRQYAKELKSEMTEAEKLLWSKIRRKQLNGVKFCRQKIIGNYIVDFLSFERMLIIEIDGGQHACQISYDNARTLYLEQQGFRVIRFWNSDILFQIDNVMEQLWELTRD